MCLTTGHLRQARVHKQPTTEHKEGEIRNATDERKCGPLCIADTCCTRIASHGGLEPSQAPGHESQGIHQIRQDEDDAELVETDACIR